MVGLPVIDLSGIVDRETDDGVARAVDRACREVGFFAVVGHGVDSDLIADAHAAAARFFDLPEADRMTAARPDTTYPYGYVPFSVEALERSVAGLGIPDLKETYNVGPVGEPPRPRDQMTDPDERAAWAPTIWPSAMPDLRPILEEYYLAMSHLADHLMSVFAVALGLPPNWFDPFIDAHSSALRLAHYPALTGPPPSGALRAGPHTDYGTLTILRLDREPGLQVQGRDGSWFDVDAPDGAFVINLGDLMQRWTNDRWRSTIHRVVVPADGFRRARLTMPFFHNANWDARIECLTHGDDDEAARYEPVLAGAHLMAKFRSTVANPGG